MPLYGPYKRSKFCLNGELIFALLRFEPAAFSHLWKSAGKVSDEGSFETV